MCALHQDSSIPPLTQELYTFHMLRPTHLDIDRSFYTAAPSVWNSLPQS